MPEFIQERKSKDGKHVTYRVTIPYYSSNKRVFFTESFSSERYGSKKIALELAKECRDKMRKFLNVDGVVVNNQDYTLDEIFEMSYDTFPLAYETRRKQTIYYNRYIKPFVKDLNTKNINSSIIQKTLNAMINTSSQNEINRVFSLWKRLIKTAMFNDALIVDPSLKVIVPKSLKITKQRDVTTSRQELEDLTETLFIRVNKNDALLIYCALWIMYYTGMRPSEVYALEWDNIDRENKTIYVCQAIGSNHNEKHVIVKTKTPSSVRTIPYPDNLDEILNLLKGEQYLFKRSNGEFLNGDFVSNTLYRLTGGKLRTYMLRHQFSTDLILKKVDVRTIQELMGHTNSSMTVNYARSNEKVKKTAISGR